MLTNVVNIDVDWMDPVYIQSMSIRPHDQTSNPSWLSIQLQDSSNEVLLANTAKELLGEEWVTIYTRMVPPTSPGQGTYWMLTIYRQLRCAKRIWASSGGVCSCRHCQRTPTTWKPPWSMRVSTIENSKSSVYRGIASASRSWLLVQVLRRPRFSSKRASKPWERVSSVLRRRSHAAKQAVYISAHITMVAIHSFHCLISHQHILLSAADRYF